MSVHLESVKRVLKRYGNNDYSLVRITNTVSATDPTDTTQIPVSDNIQSYPEKYKSSEIDGNLIKMKDIKLYVDPSTLTSAPTTSDKITDGTNIFSIKSIKRWKEADTICLYLFQLRK